MRGFLIGLLGLLVCIETAFLEIGTPRSMGPGFFPMMLGIFLIMAGLIIFYQDFSTINDRENLVPILALASVIVPLLFFSWSLPKLGLAITVFITAVSSLLISRQTSWQRCIMIGGFISAMSIMIFYVILSIHVPL